ncbi:MAG: PH domain-containing protein [Oscillibacter sp.]|nr:PH domain-containing protein [Oscillibacter sp.]
MTLEEDRLSVKALSFSETVLYADIESISTASDIDYGTRTLGSDTISIKTGTFRAPRFGSYRCAVVSAQKEVIIVKKHDGSYLVFNTKDSGQLSLLADRLRQAVFSQAAS